MTTDAALPGVQLVLLERIELDPPLQPRQDMDPGLIDEYSDRMQAGDQFPPLVAYWDDAHLWLSEGWHRYAAARQVGLEALAVEVRLGTWRDALLNSLASNGDHGLRRSNADKRRAIIAMVVDPEWAQWSDKAIGDHLGVSHHTVAKYRPAPSPPILASCQDSEGGAPIHPPPDLRRLVERNGTTYEMDVSAIGSRQPTLTETLARGLDGDPDVQQSRRRAALSRVFARISEDIASLPDLEQTVAEADVRGVDQIVRNVRYLRAFADRLEQLLAAHQRIRRVE